MPKHTNDGTGRRPTPASPPATRSDDSDDHVLAAVLIRMWALASGRTLRSDVPPDQLSEEELIAFWADDMTAPVGRHAKPGNPSRTPRAWYQEPANDRASRTRRRNRQRTRRKSATGKPRRPADTAAA